MNKKTVQEVIDAMETAYTYILETVPPGTPGKIEAVTELRYTANQIFFEYATNQNNRRTV